MINIYWLCCCCYCGCFCAHSPRLADTTGDTIYAVGAYCYLAAALREDGWFWSVER